jgi:hypothetical protein
MAMKRWWNLLRQQDGLEEPAVKAARFEGDEKPLPDSKVPIIRAARTSESSTASGVFFSGILFDGTVERVQKA